jgi:hypothetical protein
MITDLTIKDHKTHLRAPFDAFLFLDTQLDFLSEKIVEVVKKIFAVNKNTDSIIVTSEMHVGNLTVVSQTMYSNST